MFQNMTLFVAGYFEIAYDEWLMIAKTYNRGIQNVDPVLVLHRYLQQIIRHFCMYPVVEFFCEIDLNPSFKISGSSSGLYEMRFF